MDISTVVLSHIDGYAAAAVGVGLSGPLTAAQLASIAPAMNETQVKTYARTFVNPGGRQAALIGFDLQTVEAAQSFESGAREGAAKLGAVGTVARFDQAFTVRPDSAKTTQEVFVQVGPFVFVLVLSDQPTSKFADTDVTDLVLAQAGAVPPDLAAQTASSKNGALDAVHGVGYAVGIALPIAVIVLVVVLVARRRRS